MSIQSVKIFLFIGLVGIVALLGVLAPTNMQVQAQTARYKFAFIGWGSAGRIAGGKYLMDVIVNQPEADQISGGSYIFNGGIGDGHRVVISQQSIPDDEGSLFLPLIYR